MKAFKAGITLAIHQANQKYIERVSNPNLNQQGINPDLSTAINKLNSYTDAMIDTLENFGIDSVYISKQITNNTNIKKTKQLIQFLGFVASQQANYLNGSSRYAFITFMCMLFDVKTKADINKRFLDNLETMKFNSVYSSIKLQSNVRMLLMKYRKHINTDKTISTQLSVSVSDDGILSSLGICDAMSTQDDYIYLHHNNAITRRLINMIENVDSKTLEEWLNKLQKTNER